MGVHTDCLFAWRLIMPVTQGFDYGGLTFISRLSMIAPLRLFK